jgi:hypothetical protein
MPEHRRRGRVRRRRMRPISMILFAAAVLGLSLALQPPADGQNGPAPGQTPPLQPARALDGPLDKPLAMLREGQRTFATVKDYTSTVQSRENVRGVLLDENVATLKMRTQPFSVYMRWLAPKSSAGQEVCFVTGKNNNKMRVRSTKLGTKVFGFQSIDINDPRVTEHSRHTILEAGLGNLIDQTLKHWEMENRLGKTQVKMAEYTCNNRRCMRVETTRTERVQGFYCYRSVMYIDMETKLPIRSEAYDWPRAGGPADGELLEMFSYIDLRLNVGLADADFNK